MSEHSEKVVRAFSRLDVEDKHAVFDAVMAWKYEHDGLTSERNCATCGKTSVVGVVAEYASRKSRRYCSDACRMKALRGRQ